MLDNLRISSRRASLTVKVIINLEFYKAVKQGQHYGANYNTRIGDG